MRVRFQIIPNGLEIEIFGSDQTTSLVTLKCGLFF